MELRILAAIPDVVFVVDIGHEKNAVREAQTLRLTYHRSC